MTTRDRHDQTFTPTGHDRPGYLSLDAIAAGFGVSTTALAIWLRAGADLGVRFELVSSLLALAYEQLGDEVGHCRWAYSRERLVLSEDGVVGIDIDGPDEHARIDRYWEAVALAALTGDGRALRRFADVRIRGVALVSEVDALSGWAQAAVSPGAA